MNKLIDVITNDQEKNGSFSNNILTSSLILIELKKVSQNDQIILIRKKLKDWLLEQKDKNWIFNENLMINFIAISALTEDIDGESLGKILNILTSREKQEGGPYYSNDKQVDLGFNVAIAHFLFLNKVELPNINELIEIAIDKKDFSSNLLDSFLIIYLISKIYQGTNKQKLSNYILEKINNLEEIDKALALSALVSLKTDVNTSSNKETESPLIAAIYLNLENTKTSDIKDVNYNEEWMLKKIITKAENRFSSLSPDLKNIALSEIKRTLGTNKDKQMSLISYYFKNSLGSRGKIISDDLIAEAGLANIFFWTAFIIYDDFWDEDEKAIPSILPCANLYARHYTDFYNNILPETPEFHIFFHNLMDKLDTANTWETLHCRTKVIGSKFVIPDKLPDYQNYEYKFQAASGQILGPLVMLIKSGFSLNSQETSNLIEYFKNYLIAMQINDDAHDWVEDMERGHLSTVVVMLIKDWQEKFPNKLEIDLINDLAELQKLFWFKTIKVACETAVSYTEKSRKSLESLKFLEDPSPLARFINIAENVAKSALTEQQKSLDILKVFK